VTLRQCAEFKASTALFCSAADLTARTTAAEAVFQASISTFLSLMGAMFHVCACTGKPEDKNLAKAAQQLQTAQRSVSATHPASGQGREAMVALMRLCTALYAIATNDLPAADEVLSKLCHSLVAPPSGAQRQLCVCLNCCNYCRRSSADMPESKR
jgi:hypothetical protein